MATTHPPKHMRRENAGPGGRQEAAASREESENEFVNSRHIHGHHSPSKHLRRVNDGPGGRQEAAENQDHSENESVNSRYIHGRSPLTLENT